MKNKKILIILLFWFFTTGWRLCAEEDKISNLTMQLMEAKATQGLAATFEELKGAYFKDNKYNDFVELLKSLNIKNNLLDSYVNYYTALSRYKQLKYLEQEQNWDEYFANGNTYRQDLTKAAENTINNTTAKDPLNLFARLILWQFHKDQQDALGETALADLISEAIEYAKDAADIKPLKDTADQLQAYGEKAKARELYRLYVNKLAAQPSLGIEDLANTALGFHKQGNLELSEIAYDALLEKSAADYPKEKLAALLTDIARNFSYQDNAANDPLYAEKIFQKLEAIAGKDVFNEELIYLRAFNLEKNRDYKRTKDIYLDLLSRYPQGIYAGRVNFKLGIIYIYVFSDIAGGKSYLEKLAGQEIAGPQGISSLYQLGLLSQWQEDFTKAKQYYNDLLKKAGEDFPETAALAKARAKEIDENKPLDYNLKTFLDLSLKQGDVFNGAKLELVSLPSVAKLEEGVSLSATALTAEAGCMQVELHYLWSGDCGKTQPSSEQGAFETTYREKGTKLINLIVTSPAGIIDRSFDFVDVR